jgi:hypothetical protein
VAQVLARAKAGNTGLDPVTLMHVAYRSVQKDCITIENIEFWSPTLRPLSGQHVEVRYDAAAENCGRLAEVFVRIGSGADAQYVRCAPRATMQDTMDRDDVRREAQAYQEALREQVEQAAEDFAEMVGGAGAAQRQANLHRTRRAQGRPGQQQSGYGAPRPEVEEGVRRHQEEVLNRKVKNRRGRKARPQASSRKRSTGTATAAAPRADTGWQELAKAADGRPGGVRRRSA